MPDKKKHDTLLRQLEMLRLIPKLPSPPMTSQQLRDGLAASGFDVDARTVQRDLKLLATMFLIDVNDRAPPFGWRWARDARFDIPEIQLAEALALELVQQHLTPLLPAAQLDSLRGLFLASRKKLDAVGNDNPLSQWASRVRVLPAQQALLAPPVDPDVQAVIYEGLLKRLQVSVTYRNGRGEVREGLPLHLLALVQRGPITFLVARAREYDDVRLFDLHRIEAAELLRLPVRETPPFDLDAYLASGALDFARTDRVVRLELRVTAQQAKYLSETPLSADQVISGEPGAEWQNLVATVNDTPQLRWWLQSLGDRCEVIKPEALRAHFVDLAKRLGALYRGA